MPLAEARRSSNDAEPPLLLLGASPAARRLDEAVRLASQAPCVLVEGERGFDVEEIVRLLHALSGRPGTCVVPDVGAGSPGIERTLFGRTAGRGAGAADAIGAESALARARGGTLYVGELADLPASAQARLARLARTREARIGGELSVLDVALVAAAGAADGSAFAAPGCDARVSAELQPLFEHVRLVLPPLRQRTEDIPAIVDALVARACAEAGVGRKTLTQAATALLAAMPWRGNLLELRQAIARIVRDVAGDLVQPADVLAHVRFDGAQPAPGADGTLRSARQQFEREYIALVLRHHRGRVGDAARALGIQRTNLYRKARQLGISVARPAPITAAAVKPAG